MPGPTKPPPGAMSSLGTPDVSSLMKQGMAAKGVINSGSGGSGNASTAQAQQLSQMMQGAGQKGGKASAGTASSGAASSEAASGGTGSSSHTSGFQHQKTPRAVGTIQEEAKQMAVDIKDAVFENVKGVLGLTRPPKTPEEQAQLEQFHQGWQGLDTEQQHAAQSRIQKEDQRLEVMAQEDEMKKQQEEEAKAQQSDLSMPQGKRSGQAALDKMQQDRQSMGGASG